MAVRHTNRSRGTTAYSEMLYLGRMIKMCRRHGQTGFVFRPDGNRYRCKKCSAEAVSRRRRKLKKMAVELLGGKCQECGYNKCIDALDFHHKDPAQKEYHIAGKTHSWARIKAEVSKCALLCANCHREVHAITDH